MAGPPRRPYSLRRRLLWVIAGSSVTLWLAGLSLMALIASRETNDVFDGALKESGYLIMAATTDWNERGLANHTGISDSGARKLAMQYQIVAGGKVVQRTAGAPAQPFVSTVERAKGFENIQIGATRWRVFVARSADQRFVVQVGQDERKRSAILYELAEHLWQPALAVLTLLAVASWGFIGCVIAPIGRTALAIGAKSPDDLTLLDGAGQPAELLPVIDALNGMLARLDAALQAERRFTADAAHELRTPLAAVHMHCQLLQRQHPALAPSLHKLRNDTERSTALVDQLLALARLDPIRRENLGCERTALAPVLDELMRAHSATAETRGICLRLDCRLEQLSVNPDMLRVALRNLIDNALRYCGAGSVVELSAGALGGAAQIAVRDNGPGVSVGDRARLAERFFRVLGSEQDGSGLGLSIVRRIVELHGAQLHFGPGLDGRGLGAVIDFPAAVR